MYDMYPWNETDSGANRDRDGARHANGDDVPAEFSQAVQFALDRRDNGGDAATPPAARPAIQGATRPAASQARQ